jgi:dephospho-CoA kinase
MGRGGKALPQVTALFPAVVRNGSVDRRALGALVFGDPAALARLEAVLHPMVRAAERRFLAAAARQRRRFVVLDIPLLFESHSEQRCDATLLVSAPAFLQRQRVMRRPGMDEARFRGIMPHREKRRRANFVVMTGLDKRLSLRRLLQIVRILLQNPPSPPRWSPHARNRSGYGNHRPRS